jgi:Fe2+ or Zn2+ uptake regulation protein
MACTAKHLYFSTAGITIDSETKFNWSDIMKSSALDKFQSSGYKLTRQRRIVLSILEEGSKHPGAEELFRLAKQKDPKISLATIYRSLSVFKKIGLIQENDFGEDHGHYEKITNHPHFHFTCSQCGQVFELRSKKIMRQIKELCQEEGLQMTGMNLLVHGLCQNCQDGKANP